MTNHFVASQASVTVVEQLEHHGYEAVFVGGAVRDYLLGKRATDIDIATSAEPDEVKEVFETTIDVGIEHGTVLVLIDEEPIEVTTYRTGEENVQPHIEKSLREDLSRRDFTMNALAMTKDQQLLDFFGGQQDLQKRLIRAVESPEKRFEEDPLRMLRAIRFASVLDFTIEEKTFHVMKQKAEMLQGVAVERIKAELDKLFVNMNPKRGCQLLVDSGLSKALPVSLIDWSELGAFSPFQSSRAGWAIFMLLGKFRANEVSAAYKLSNDEKRFLAHVEKAYAGRLRQAFTVDDLYLYDAMILYLVEKYYSIVYHEKDEVSLNDFEQAKERLPIQSLKDLSVSGQDLLKWANVRGGRWVGEWMKKIERAVLHGQCENNRDFIKEWFINDFDSEK